MNKPLLVYQAPVFTRSGYGDHARDILRSLFELNRYDIKIVPTILGNTPQNQADPNTEFGKKMLSNIATQVNRKPDIFMQMSVANEFEPKGNYNIGITAGVETTVVPKEFFRNYCGFNTSSNTNIVITLWFKFISNRHLHKDIWFSIYLSCYIR